MFKAILKLVYVLLVLFSLLNYSFAYLSRKVITTYGQICLNSCEKRGYSYSWCDTARYCLSVRCYDWDYCSEEPTKSIRGDECRSICSDDAGKYDYKYCTLKKGSWDYCGTFLYTSFYITNKYNKECVDSCQLDADRENYVCHDYDQVKHHCSPWQGLATNFDYCTSECGFKGESYEWCWTEGGKYRWNYCSFNDPSFYDYDRNKKRAINGDFFREVLDTGNLLATHFSYQESDKEAPFAQASKNEIQHANELIRKWDGSIPGCSCTIISNYFVRLDLQGFLNRDGIRYANIQLQLNVQRSPGQHTTIAQVHIPMIGSDPNTVLRYMRYALAESLNSKKRVVISKQTLPSSYRRRLYRR